MTFRVGQKVVCVDDRNTTLWSQQWIKKGGIYTVARILRPISAGLNDHLNSSYGIDLVEVPMKPNGFGVLRFRPIVERKTDISIFTKMLTGKRVDA